MKKLLIIVMMLCVCSGMSAQVAGGRKNPYSQYTVPISNMPKGAVQFDELEGKSVYIQTTGTDGDVQIVWLANSRTGQLTKVCQTNPQAGVQWERMNQPTSNGVSVQLNQIAKAEKAYIAPGDGSKVIVEGCPDGRNIWTYVIDTKTHSAIQFPSTEGVAEINHDTGELTLGFYSYDDEGRYGYQKVFTTGGKFLRRLPGKDRY